MEEVESLVRTTMQEIEKVFSTKTVVGEPMTVQDKIIIPLIAIGFCFGVGGGGGKGEMQSNRKGEGSGGGSTGAAGIKPVALVVFGKDGNITIEPIKGAMTAVLEKWGDVLPNMMEKCMEKWSQRKEQQG